jgi:hypothetical protein
MRSSVHHSSFITIAALARKRSSTLELESVLRSSLLHEDVQACADVRRYERKALSSMSMDERTMLDSMSTTMRDVPSLWSVPSLWVTKRRFTGAALVRDATETQLRAARSRSVFGNSRSGIDSPYYNAFSHFRPGPFLIPLWAP